MKPTDYADLVADPGRFLAHEDAAIRRLAVAACAGRIDDPLEAELVRLLGADPTPQVRAAAAEVLAIQPGRTDAILGAADDSEPVVREAVATALGELETPAAVPWLLRAAADDPDRLVREAAVAALGAIGDERALDVLLRLVADGPPQIRRRSVVALSVFDGADVEAALRAAAQDRNPMVREAAEMVVGRPAEWEPVEFRAGPSRRP